jgi:hypothetical protein
MPPDFTTFFDAFEPLDVALWLAGGGGLLVILTPIIFTRTGIRLNRYVADPNPTLAEPNGTDPEYSERFAELESLGFRSAGIVYEQTYLFMHRLYRCNGIRQLISSDQKTYVALYRLRRGALVRVTFTTVLTDDRLVRTAMPGAGIGKSDSEYHRVEVPWQPVAGVYERHKAEVSAYLSTHGGTVIAATLADQAAVDQRIERKQLRTIGLGRVATFPVYGWLAPFAFVLIALRCVSNLSLPREIGIAGVAAGVAYWLYVSPFDRFLLNFVERLEAAGCGAKEASGD